MIKGVLFDSGDTLVRPKAGEWFPKQHFLDAFRARGVTDANMDRFEDALDVGHFDAFVISALVGSRKPSEAIYRAAVNEIGIPPEGLVFVDDRPVNVEAAEELGMKGVVISRYGKVPNTDLPVIPDLDSLIAIVIPETATRNVTE